MKAFGSMRLEAVEFIKIVLKFCGLVSGLLIKHNVFHDIVSLYTRYPNASLLHTKLNEILLIGLKSGIKELVDNILYGSDLVKLILSITTDTEKFHLNFSLTKNSSSHSSLSYLYEIANHFITNLKDDPEIAAMAASIPEWG